MIIDGRASLQQERIEDRRLASAVRADEYHEPRSGGYVGYRELGETLVVLQAYVFYSHPITLVAVCPGIDPSNRHYRPLELCHPQPDPDAPLVFGVQISHPFRQAVMIRTCRGSERPTGPGRAQPISHLLHRTPTTAVRPQFHGLAEHLQIVTVRSGRGSVRAEFHGLAEHLPSTRHGLTEQLPPTVDRSSLYCGEIRLRNASATRRSMFKRVGDQEIKAF